MSNHVDHAKPHAATSARPSQHASAPQAPAPLEAEGLVDDVALYRAVTAQGTTGAAPPPPDSGNIRTLQRTAGNHAVGRMLAPPQAGAQVVQRSTDAAQATHGKSCGCNSCSTVQRITSRIDPLSTRVQRSADAHEHGCGCKGCASRQSIVQRTPIHARSLVIQRSADTAFMRPPLKAQNFSSALAPIRPVFAGDTLVQRHASWEHRMLGDIKPDELATLGTWQEAIDAQKQEAEEGPVSLMIGQEVQVSDAQIKTQNIVHVLEQEIKRLKVWQDPANTPKGSKSDDVDRLKHIALDPEWQLHLVEIPNKQPGGDPLVVTYGELNTLADFYCSADELLQTDLVKVRNVAQSVRQQSFQQLLNIYTKIKGLKDEAAAKKELDVEELTFKGAFGITTAGDEIGQMAKDQKGAIDDTSAYSATLGRNACHFAPESWHAWADWHGKAIAKAKEAHALYAEADELREAAKPKGEDIAIPGMDNGDDDNGMVEISLDDSVDGDAPQVQQPELQGGGDGGVGAKMQAAHEAQNLAMLYNGFGDHYLQDSYAAGHLINKTQIMQWFVQYLDKHEDKLTYTIDTSWRQFQSMAYDQEGLADPEQYDQSKIGTRKVKNKDGQDEEVSSARNPQTVENTQSNKNLTWVQRFELLGLKLPNSVTNDPKALTLLLYMQENSNLMSKWSWTELKEKIKVPVEQSMFAQMAQKLKAPKLGLANEGELQAAVQSLLDDQIIFMGTLGRFKDTVSKYTTAKMKRGEAVDVFNDNNFFELRKEWTASTVGGGDFSTAAKQAKEGNMAPYERMAKAAVYKDFVKFLKDSFLQKSTNALHDYYCINGLKVKSGAGEDLGKIYGDMHMLDKESARGVAHSAATANMSRDSILAVARTGAEPGAMTTAKILDRLPAEAEVGPDTYVGLDVWHNNPAYLRKKAEDTVFANMTSVSDVGAGMISTVKSLGKMSKDEDIHGGEAF